MLLLLMVAQVPTDAATDASKGRNDKPYPDHKTAPKEKQTAEKDRQKSQTKKNVLKDFIEPRWTLFSIFASGRPAVADERSSLCSRCGR